ncbi:glycosyltransferase [Vibrio cyclitrophicus]
MINIKEVVLRSEKEIISSWVNKENIVVSVVCSTYNHESYIEDAIISFLMQETNFAFEVIIHDDASNDETTNIIRKYQSLYQNIIKPIFQKENQYSKGGFKPLIYAMGFASGEYLALCEGDDYWIDQYKLNNQLALLKKNSEIQLCFSDGLYLWKDGTSKKKGGYTKTSYTIEEVISGGGAFMITASLMINSQVLKSLPDWLPSSPVGDYVIQVLGSKGGAVRYEVESCVYRVEAVGSWSSSTDYYGYTFYNKMKTMFDNLDKELCEEYKCYFKERKIERIVNFIISRVQHSHNNTMTDVFRFLLNEPKLFFYATVEVLRKALKKAMLK